jgi:hypothetical protein
MLVGIIKNISNDYMNYDKIYFEKLQKNETFKLMKFLQVM